MNVRTFVAACALVVGVSTIGNRPAYGADVVREPDPTSDAYEFNEDSVHARDLYDRHQLISYLSIMPVGDVDYYLWTTRPRKP